MILKMLKWPISTLMLIGCFKLQSQKFLEVDCTRLKFNNSTEQALGHFPNLQIDSGCLVFPTIAMNDDGFPNHMNVNWFNFSGKLLKQLRLIPANNDSMIMYNHSIQKRGSYIAMYVSYEPKNILYDSGMQNIIYIFDSTFKLLKSLRIQSLEPFGEYQNQLTLRYHSEIQWLNDSLIFLPFSHSYGGAMVAIYNVKSNLIINSKTLWSQFIYKTYFFNNNIYIVADGRYPYRTVGGDTGRLFSNSIYKFNNYLQLLNFQYLDPYNRCLVSGSNLQFFENDIYLFAEKVDGKLYTDTIKYPLTYKLDSNLNYKGVDKFMIYKRYSTIADIVDINENKFILTNNANKFNEQIDYEIIKTTDFKKVNVNIRATPNWNSKGYYAPKIYNINNYLAVFGWNYADGINRYFMTFHLPSDLSLVKPKFDSIYKPLILDKIPDSIYLPKPVNIQNVKMFDYSFGDSLNFARLKYFGKLKSLRVNPNPASSIITIQNSSSEKEIISIVSLNGQVVGKTEIDAKSSGNFNFDRLPAGIYFIIGKQSQVKLLVTH